MKTTIGFRLSVTICAAILFVGAFSFLSVPTHAEGAAAKAAKVAKAAVDDATAAQTAAIEAEKKAGTKKIKQAKAQKSYAEPDDAGVPVVTKSTDGMRVINFDTSAGRIVVNLPDDMMAGDTISGTVVAEPKGVTDQERTKNSAELSGYVVELNFPRPRNEGDKKPPPNVMVILDAAKSNGFKITLPDTKTGQKLLGVNLRQLSPSERSKFGAPKYFPLRENETAPGRLIATPSSDAYMEVSEPAVWGETANFNIPPLGQTGRPIVITGPFDGNSSNTTINALAPRTLVQDFEKNTENVSGGFGLLAESPRKAVFKSPENVTGPIQITVKEGDKQTTGTYRNVGVNLTAPKTNLLKGERTELRVEVNGLQGITQPVPLHLVTTGVVTIQGGEVQSMTIKPAEVPANGTFSMTRGITGVEAGVWNATATVVVFDTCLQDDNSGDMVVYSSATRDFIFCQGRGNLAGANPISLSTLNFGAADFTGGVRVAAGDVNGSGGNETRPVSIGPGASIYRSGAITVADFNYKVGSIHVQIDSLNNTGNASGFVYQPITVPANASPKKVNFTITDRDMRNNTCSCR